MVLRIGDILIEKKLISREDLDKALRMQYSTGEPLGRLLIRMKLIKEEDLLQALSEQQNIEIVNLKETEISPEVLTKMPAKFAWHYKIMPIRITGRFIVVAISDPFDADVTEAIETNIGYSVDRVLAYESDIIDAIRTHYGLGADTVEEIMEDKPKRIEKSLIQAEKVQDLEKLVYDTSVVKLVNQILQEAIQRRATDVHIERYRDDFVLRYRIDGILYNTTVPPDTKYLYNAIISRIKVMCGLDIVERRLPQDGRTRVKIRDEDYDLRISVVPTLYGENLVIRILPTTMLLSFDKLGLSSHNLKKLEDIIKMPHGLIFVTGPTGSGKSTTLYAALRKLNTSDRKIITIEDPVEYELKGVTQTQINPKIGLTFAASLRSMLRHDPDVMMVGEVRDQETAEITIQVAMTGHLVLSTLHTNTASGAIARLIDMGIEPFLISSSCLAFIAQRLVRTICDGCRIEDKDASGLEKMKQEIMSHPKGCYSNHDRSSASNDDRSSAIYGAIDISKMRFYKGTGCKVCNNTGYKGRAGIYEILVVDEEIISLINAKAASGEIEKKAISKGMRTLKQDGLRKVLEGLTTIEEVVRVTRMA